jgi:nitroreductase
MLKEVFEYHDLSKHRFEGYAPGPGRLDWANQPDPFRRDAPLPTFGEATQSKVASAPVNQQTIARLLQDSLALAAWKSFGESRWALRINPSSGNLHPTESYIVATLDGETVIAHYAPQAHALEIRARLPNAQGLPPGGFLLGLSSIPWREAWKYGERAFRYCHHDVGHAIGAIAYAAAGLGWSARVLRGCGTDSLARLLGIAEQTGPFREHADCLLAIAPQGTPIDDFYANVSVAGVTWHGEPNSLSTEYRAWPWVEKMPEVTKRPCGATETRTPVSPRPAVTRFSDPGLHALVRQRRPGPPQALPRKPAWRRAHS